MSVSCCLIVIVLIAGGCGSHGDSPPGPIAGNRSAAKSSPGPKADAVVSSDKHARGEDADADEDAVGSEAEANNYTPAEPLETPLPPLDEIAKECRRFDIPFLEFTIDTEGKTKNHKYIRGTGCDSADQILLRYVQLWTFRPAQVDGHPVSEDYTTAIHW